MLVAYCFDYPVSCGWTIFSSLFGILPKVSRIRAHRKYMRDTAANLRRNTTAKRCETEAKTPATEVRKERWPKRWGDEENAPESENI